MTHTETQQIVLTEEYIKGLRNYFSIVEAFPLANQYDEATAYHFLSLLEAQIKTHFPLVSNEGLINLNTKGDIK